MSSNAQCNALQAVVGVFTHSANTAERVVELMAHSGLSVAPISVNRMIEALSKEAVKDLAQQLPGMITAIAYDNLDINFQTEQPTIEYSGHLAHITTGTFIPLRGASKEDMRVSHELWEKSALNPNRSASEEPVHPTHQALMGLIRSAGGWPPDDPASLESRMAWHIREVLLADGVDTLAPAVKEKLRLNLGQPEIRNQIPVAKTTQRPARAMNISVSNNAGNAAAIENLLKQGGMDESMLDEYVVFVHGDLGTGEKLENIKRSRRIEATPQKRLQYALWIPGFLHIAMAIADSLWRMYLQEGDTAKRGGTKPESIFYLCSLLRPRDTKKLATKSNFRMTRHVVNNARTALLANAWRLVVKSKYDKSLEDWLPTWGEVIDASREIARTYVAGLMFAPSHQSTPESADMVNDTTKLFI